MRRIFKQEYLQGCTSVLGVQNQHLDDGMQYLDSGIQLESGSEFVSGYMKSRYADIRAILNTKKQHNIEQSVTLGKRYADLTNTDGSSSGKLEGQLEIVENLLSQLERLCASMGNSVSNIQSENPNGAILLDNLSSSRVADMQAGNMYEWFDENGNYNIKVIGLWMLMDDSRLTEQQIQIRDQYIRDVIANKDHSTIVDLMRDYIYIDCDKFSKSQQDFYAAVEANCDELIADYWTNEANFGENWWTNERKRENALGYLTLESVMKDGLDVDALRFSSNTKAINPKEQAYQLLLLDVPSEEIDWSQLYNKTENLMSTYGVDFQDCGNIIPPEQVMYFYLEHEALEAWADENARAVISMALDMCPGVGDVKNGIEFFAQKDLITGQKLTAFDYAMMIVPTAILRHTPSGIRKIVGRLPGGKYADDIAETAESVAKHVDEVAEGTGKVEVGKGGKYSDAVFASQDKLISHYDKHGAEFKGLYNSADEYLQGARDVMNNGYKVEYSYKGETRIGFVQFMGNNSKGKAKFAFVGTNNEGYITTFHTESGKTFWKLLNNGENIPVINPK